MFKRKLITFNSRTKHSRERYVAFKKQIVKEYYCIELKFKNEKISTKTFHAHLFVSDKQMSFQIIENEVGSRIDNDFMVSKNCLGLFEDNFEIVKTEVSFLLDNSRIYKVQSFKNDGENNFFTVYVSKIALI